jgi:hypothetical protein
LPGVHAAAYGVPGATGSTTSAAAAASQQAALSMSQQQQQQQGMMMQAYPTLHQFQPTTIAL